MTRSHSLALALALTFIAATAGPSRAQAPDTRWNDWLGCWSLVADGNVARLPPAEDAAGGITGPIRPGGSRSARVCVSPSRGGAELKTFVGDQPVLTQTIVADGADHPVSDAGCSGVQRARWSDDGLRLFTRAQVTCEKQPARTVTGLALIAPDGEWVDVQAVTIGDTDSVRVRRYRAPKERADKGVPAAAVHLQIDDVKEATKYVSPRAIEAALMETSARFPLSSRVLVDLDKAGVDDRVIDLMVALSYPRSFAIRPSGPDDRLTPFPPFDNGFLDASYDYPYFYGPYYSNYYYSPYFFSPFGYSYLRYYPQFYSPVAVIVPGEVASGGGGAGAGRPPETGRVINGKGYTQVDRRGDVATATGSADAGGTSTRSSGSSRGTVSPRGYSAGDAGGSSSSSSGGGGSSSSGGSSSGASSSGGGGGDGGRTAVPR